MMDDCTRHKSCILTALYALCFVTACVRSFLLRTRDLHVLREGDAGRGCANWKC